MDANDPLIKAVQEWIDEKPKAIRTKRFGTIYKREPNADEFEAYVAAKGRSASDSDGPEDVHNLAVGAALCIADENGKRKFDPCDKDDIRFLGKWPWALLNKLQPEDSTGINETGN